MKRSAAGPILADLERKMVFLSGPRQVGKTTLARAILAEASPENQVYLNWDDPADRKTMRSLAWDRSPTVVVLDEIHKFGRWKNLIKGFHDKEGHRQRLLVTGSAKLDIARRRGDSLAGRYHRYRLHPLSLGEASRQGGHPDAAVLQHPDQWLSCRAAPIELQGRLLAVGGFPEPFLEKSSRAVGRWRLERRDQILRQDARDLTSIRDLTLVEQLADLLQERVASPVSLNNLRGDLEVDHKTIRNWIDVLERLFVVFRVTPFAGSLARTLRKESKIYFWDWSETPDPGARFENFIASHLLKFCHWLEDVEGVRAELRYVRDKEKREVDFLVLKDARPWLLIESKISPGRDHLSYFQPRLKVPHAFQVHAGSDVWRNAYPAVRVFSALP